jgi:serine protease DegS
MRPRLVRFLLSYVVVGVAVAAVVVWAMPDLLGTERPVVELRRAELAAASPASLGNGPVSYAEAVDRAAPAVVNIFTSTRIQARPNPLLEDPFFRRFFGQQTPESRERTETSLGSGVIVSPQGYLLTNNHVIQGADEIRVSLADGRDAPATLVGADAETDLAVLRIELDELPVIGVGASDRLRVGDVVLAIGNPFGVGQTVTQGIVSAVDRRDLGLNTFENFVQTDAAINPGNSGGALVDAHGRLVGINTAIFSRTGGSQGIGFAIPVATVEDVLTSIIEQGRVVRGWIGVEIQMLTPSLAESFGLSSTEGAVIAGVLRGGPAAEAGLVPGDIILRIGEQPVGNARNFLRLVTEQKPGDTLELAGVRAGQPFRSQLTIGERPPVNQLGR